MNFIKNNPAVFNSIIVSLVTAILTVLVEVGVDVSETLQEAIIALLVIIGGIVIGIWTRGQVVPFQNVVEYRPVEDGEASPHILAGPANDMKFSGEQVRVVGETFDQH